MKITQRFEVGAVTRNALGRVLTLRPLPAKHGAGTAVEIDVTNPTDFADVDALEIGDVVTIEAATAPPMKKQ